MTGWQIARLWIVATLIYATFAVGLYSLTTLDRKAASTPRPVSVTTSDNCRTGADPDDPMSWPLCDPDDNVSILPRTVGR